jgi:Xaa-Pro aminopeptidase
MVEARTSRIARLGDALKNRGLDAFIGWSPVTMGYLSGFFEGGGERFMALCVRTDGELHLICPALSATQASRAGIASIAAWKDGEDPLALFRELADRWNLRSAIVGVDNELPAHMLLSLQEALPAALFKPGFEALSSLMRVKETTEMDSLRRAAAIADKAFDVVLPTIRVGATEAELEAAITAEMSRLGGKPAFCIVAAGAAGAEPHHLSDDTAIRQGDVVVLDFGCTVDGYYSDITRTVASGDPGDEARRVYSVAYEAHMAAREAAKPGVQAQELDRIARRIISDAGFGANFMHRLGHGIGMRGHEEPNLVEGNTHLLEPGNCFSVEPGIYLAGRFGVRIENIVSVTESGSESLNADPNPKLLVL